MKTLIIGGTESLAVLCLDFEAVHCLRGDFRKLSAGSTPKTGAL